MEKQPSPRGEILLYSSGDSKEFVSVIFKDENFWMTQKAMGELFGWHGRPQTPSS